MDTLKVIPQIAHDSVLLVLLRARFSPSKTLWDENFTHNTTLYTDLSTRVSFTSLIAVINTGFSEE